jgi:hypothetical protein
MTDLSRELNFPPAKKEFLSPSGSSGREEPKLRLSLNKQKTEECSPAKDKFEQQPMSLAESLQLDSDIDAPADNAGQAKLLNQHNESFGLDLSNLNNITSVQDQSLNDINNRLQVLKDEDQYNYNSEVSHQKTLEAQSPEKQLQPSGRGTIKETRGQLQRQIQELAETMRRDQQVKALNKTKSSISMNISAPLGTNRSNSRSVV